MVARLVRDQEVVGSNPVASTTKKGELFTAIPIGNFGKGRPLKKRAGVA